MTGPPYSLATFSACDGGEAASRPPYTCSSGTVAFPATPASVIDSMTAAGSGPRCWYCPTWDSGSMVANRPAGVYQLEMDTTARTRPSMAAVRMPNSPP